MHIQPHTYITLHIKSKIIFFVFYISKYSVPYQKILIKLEDLNEIYILWCSSVSSIVQKVDHFDLSVI
jgi:hypothetical protein